MLITVSGQCPLDQPSVLATEHQKQVFIERAQGRDDHLTCSLHFQKLLISKLINCHWQSYAPRTDLITFKTVYVSALCNSFQHLFPQFTYAFYEKAFIFVCFKLSTCNLQKKEKAEFLQQEHRGRPQSFPQMYSNFQKPIKANCDQRARGNIQQVKTANTLNYQ